MRPVLATLALRSALCAGLSWLAWWTSGPTGFVISLGMWGVALARPLLDLAGELRRLMRVAVWHDVEGRHHVFRGLPVQVLEDEEGQCWIRLADVRRIVGFTAGDGALALSYPQGWRQLGRPPQPHLRADALLEHLGKESSPTALKLKHWVQREIAYPAQRRRERR